MVKSGGSREVGILLGPDTKRVEVKRMKVVILEDWNHFFPGVPSLARLRERADVEVQHDQPVDRADLLARLQGAQAVVLNRERTPFDRAVIVSGKFPLV